MAGIESHSDVLYDIEDAARDLTPEARQALRQSRAQPLLAQLRVWLDQQVAQVPSKFKLGEAKIRIVTRKRPKFRCCDIQAELGG